MTSLSVIFSLLWFLSGILTPSMGQTSPLFLWKFKNPTLSNKLPTCLPLAISLFDPRAANPDLDGTRATPPFYMIAFLIGGAPITTFIGTDEDNLSWAVTAPVGSRLALSVVDANGTAGGLPPTIYEVVAGSTTQCVTGTVQTPEFRVTANVTGDLTTCQPWGLTIKGGVPPYNITLVQPNSPIVTNVTIGFGDDHYTYINRANPDGKLIAAISDLTGRWATGTPIVNTKGSRNVDCVGLVSSSGNSTIIAANIVAENAATESEKRRKATVTGVAVTIVLLFLIGLGIGVFFYIRKRKRLWQVEEANTLPHQFPLPYTQIENSTSPGQVLSINNFLSTPKPKTLPLVPPPLIKASLLGGRYGTSSPSRGIDSPPQTSPVDPPVGRALGDDSNSPILPPHAHNRDSGRSSSRPSFTSFPSTSIRRSAKAIEAGVFSLEGSPATQQQEPALSESHSHVLGRNTSTGADSATQTGLPSTSLNRLRIPAVREEGSDNGGGVFQHEDAAAARELPPPYRSGGAALRGSVSRHLSA
ncbi:hypothetical protein NLJ89_g2479 [Agrocybe chaxingu]|uniref:Uncharacterized protein n=1 Tax=Agrocybe chaxingu TaxID=84603 RepID=A0A9W8K4B0_9AGAR|nr:hypothetical protein NLJ89_g2479 [Agrocybe chaxingu]